jgi:UrcA family protein
MAPSSDRISAPRNRSITHRGRWFATGAAALAMFTAAAQAEQAIPQVTVKYADLNLSQQADTGELYSRLQAAAARVCSLRGTRELSQFMQRRACYNEALSDAVAKVDNSALTALHDARGNVRVAQRATVNQRRS